MVKIIETGLMTKSFDVLLFTPELFDGQVSLTSSTVTVMFLETKNSQGSRREGLLFQRSRAPAPFQT